MRKFLILFLLVILGFSVTACNEKDEINTSDENQNSSLDSDNNSSLPNNENNNSDVPSIEEVKPLFKKVIFDTLEEDYMYIGTKTLAPYKAYNQDGSLIEENKYMSYAIRKAADSSSSSNKCYVLDANGLKIYERVSKSTYYCYDGQYFVGTKSRNEAIEWCKTRSRSFIIDGFGSAYQGCGTVFYEGSDFSNLINLELLSGGYNYMYTPRGRFDGDKVAENGYGYIECTVNLKNATYKPTQDHGVWNAYIFLHGNANNCADFGLKGVIENGEMVWKLFRLCSHDSHKEDGKKWYEDTALNAVTKMKYNEEEGYYEGVDNLFMQLWQGKDGWRLVVTNLTTNEKYELSEYHTDMMIGQEPYYQLLLAASYCPADMYIWNSRCEAALRNVCFTDVKVARYNSNETYEASMLEDFYPDSNMGYGFSQAADCASMIYGINQDGKKMISYSCYYDGGRHFDE